MLEKKYKKYWKNNVYQLLALVLVLIPVHVSSETWVANLDLTIPSSEMPLTWRLDLKDKQEIMMGWTCCYQNSLIEAVYQEQYMKSIESKLKERPKRLRFTAVNPEPSIEQIRLFYLLNFLDLGLTMHGLKHPSIKEGNPLLNEKPSDLELIGHKAFLAPLIEQNMNAHQLEFINWALLIAVMNNAYQIDKVDAW